METTLNFICERVNDENNFKLKNGNKNVFPASHVVISRVLRDP